MKLWVTIILIGAILIIGGSLYMFNKPVSDLSNTEAQVRTTAEKLFDEYAMDEQKADKTYLDKIVEVEGVVKEILVSNEEEIVILKSNDELFGVSCKMNDKNVEIKKEQSIKIKGKCAGLLSDVVLVRCSVVK